MLETILNAGMLLEMGDRIEMDSDSRIRVISPPGVLFCIEGESWLVKGTVTSVALVRKNEK